MQAVVQKLSDTPHNTYASQMVQYRGNYILIKVISKLLFNYNYVNHLKKKKQPVFHGR